MRTFGDTRTMPIDEFRRKLGEIKKELPKSDFIVTDRGKPVLYVTEPPEIKKERMMQMAGAWKDTELDDDDLWREVLKKKSRKADINL